MSAERILVALWVVAVGCVRARAGVAPDGPASSAAAVSAPDASSLEKPDSEPRDSVPLDEDHAHPRDSISKCFGDVRPLTACVVPHGLERVGTIGDYATFSDAGLVGLVALYDAETLESRPRPPCTKTQVDDDRPTDVSPTGRYFSVARGVGIAAGGDDGDADVVLEDVTTRRVVCKAKQVVAGGVVDYWFSPTGRYLIGAWTRGGITVYDPRPKSGRDPSCIEHGHLGPRARFAPNDRYAVDLPFPPFQPGLYSSEDVRWEDLVSGKGKLLTTHRGDESQPPGEGDDEAGVDAVFCGEGTLFAVSLDDTLHLFRGADGAHLASVPSRRGDDVSFSRDGRYLVQARYSKGLGWETAVYRARL
jgi:hypothetical protein